MSSSSQPQNKSTPEQPDQPFPILYRYDPSTDPSPIPQPHPADFTRTDQTPDADFYRTPRLVTHIDDNAISALRRYFATVLSAASPADHDTQGPTAHPSSPSATPPRILDLATSWVSHYPAPLERAAAARHAQVFGLGMNAAEMDRNSVLDSGGRVVWDLNARPDVAAAVGPLLSAPSPSLGPGSGPAGAPLSDERKLAATTCTVSIDYLVRPVAVLASLRELTCLGGSVHLAISNRCFPTKAVGRWLRAGEGQRLRMTCRDLWEAGWRDVEVLEVTDGRRGPVGGERQTGVASLVQMLGMGGLGAGDPLWVVRGRNRGEGG